MAAQFSDGAGWYEDEENDPLQPLPPSPTGSNSSNTPSYYDPFTADAYQKGWDNFRTAFSICGNQKAGAGARAFSCGYVWVWGSAHVVFVVGVTISIAEVVIPGGIACATNPQCGQTIKNTLPQRMSRVVTGNPPNITSVGKPGDNFAFVVSADDIAGLSTSRQIAQKLTLLDAQGKFFQGPFLYLHLIHLLNMEYHRLYLNHTWALLAKELLLVVLLNI
jgi:hypothetical protein